MVKELLSRPPIRQFFESIALDQTFEATALAQLRVPTLVLWGSSYVGKGGASPLDIINGPLMAGMSEVGRLFNNNELIVAEVLQSAEAMKTGVTALGGTWEPGPARKA